MSEPLSVVSILLRSGGRFFADGPPLVVELPNEPLGDAVSQPLLVALLEEVMGRLAALGADGIALAQVVARAVEGGLPATIGECKSSGVLQKIVACVEELRELVKSRETVAPRVEKVVFRDALAALEACARLTRHAEAVGAEADIPREVQRGVFVLIEGAPVDVGPLCEEIRSVVKPVVARHVFSAAAARGYSLTTDGAKWELVGNGLQIDVSPMFADPAYNAEQARAAFRSESRKND